MNPALVLRLPVAILTLVIASCGNDQCTVISMAVDPSAGTADHNALPPGNQQQFFSDGTMTSNCPAPPMETPVRRGLQDVTWTVSDTTNVSISNNTQDGTLGVATCLGATAGPATVTATLPAEMNHGNRLVSTGTITCH